METQRRCPKVERISRTGFTLVELLVVITIIGILAALITVAASGALKKGRQTAIKVELDQISAALEKYKQDVAGSYPPNLQVDGVIIDESQVLNDVRRHLKQAFPRSNEPPELIAALAGLATNGSLLPSGDSLQGGMTAGEAIVFWLSGFSSDPKYPISGEGGPSYEIPSLNNGDNHALDPIESRRWIYEFQVARLEPRDADGYFDEADGRFIEYQIDLNNDNDFGDPGELRRINFWQYVPSNSTQPYLYFDTSRHPATVLSGATVIGPFDPPASTVPGLELHVHAVKKINPTWSAATAGAVPPVVCVNPDKFQILHAGVDDEWGAANHFELMSAHGVQDSGGDPADPYDYLLYPDGPFSLDVADTIVNFTTGTLEDAQQ